ncbi:type II toxin-antitoxin system RelE/ParE family toxin [Magnetospirillum moscoviense]|uniref:Addiction module protein n=1 Tax=Magnetospirillum moscoviense TaxID=1437059 RepID=A0A178MAS9_9PROT|nr:type II toxin-antitoxin system RelE/ParE family toxin [Magnetospirillum moscoviense]OAN45852.1 addiction module protein [Magnetospirillum moscoviense]
MNTMQRTASFDAWLSALADNKGKARILARLTAAEMGNFGDCESVGEGVSEMRIHFGPGYRVYFTRRGKVVYLLLLGGDKSTQARDIKRAKELAKMIEEV